MRHLFILISALSLFISSVAQAKDVTDDDIVILYENDVHGRMHGYAQLCELRKEMQRKTENVCVVSLGDFSQGGPLCSVSHGQYAVDVMNNIGYDFITIGNHEYDYGLEQLNRLVGSLKAKTLVCNYIDLATGKTVFLPYAIRKFKNLNIGFIGCVTPITKLSDSPHSFIDDKGNDLYSFSHENFYEVIQKNIDEVRALGADVVILLAHLGDIDNSFETSEETIRRTTGIDIVLDGHAHNVIESRYVCNSQGDSILLSSTGYLFENIGQLVITGKGKYETTLIPVTKEAKQDKTISAQIEGFQATFNNLPTIAESPYELVAFDKVHDTYDRNCQTNLGSLCAEAFRVMSRADIGWINAGGVRNTISSGRITFKELLSAFPFENRICVCQFTGKQIIDALEYGISRAPEDNGSYPQVSGITFDIDLNVKSNVLSDPTKPFAGIGEGPRRVTNVQVLNSVTQKYEPIDLDKHYSLASIDFILKNHGCNGILDNGTIVQDNQMVDTQLLEDFLRNHLKGAIPKTYSSIRMKPF